MMVWSILRQVVLSRCFRRITRLPGLCSAEHSSMIHFGWQ